MAPPRITLRLALIGAFLLLAVPARAAILSHLSGDAALAALSPTFSFVAEGRIGDQGGAGTFELDLGHDTAAPATTAQYNWVSGQVEPFTITYNWIPRQVTFVMGSKTLVYTASGAMTDLFLRVRSTYSTCSISVGNLIYNGAPLGDQSVAVGATLDILRVAATNPASGFTLTGDAILSWTGAAPTQSNLAFQIKVAALPTTPVRAVTWGGVKQTYR